MALLQSYLLLGQYMGPEDYMLSGAFCLQFDPVLGLVVKQGGYEPGGVSAPVWHSYTPGTNPILLVDSSGKCWMYETEDGTPATKTKALFNIAPANAVPIGDYFLLFNSDGRLNVWAGSGPGDKQRIVASNGPSSDPMTSFDITAISYDLDKAIITALSPVQAQSETDQNNSSQAQTFNIQLTLTTAETSTWSDSTGYQLGVSTSFSSGIPGVVSGSVSISASVTKSYTWGGTQSYTNAFAIDAPVVAGPGEWVRAVIVAQQSTLSLPYQLTGTVTLQSGYRGPGVITGIYTGQASHDVTVTYEQIDPKTGKVINSVPAPSESIRRVAQ